MVWHTCDTIVLGNSCVPETPARRHCRRGLTMKAEALLHLGHLHRPQRRQPSPSHSLIWPETASIVSKDSDQRFMQQFSLFHFSRTATFAVLPLPQRLGGTCCPPPPVFSKRKIKSRMRSHRDFGEGIQSIPSPKMCKCPRNGDVFFFHFYPSFIKLAFLFIVKRPSFLRLFFGLHGKDSLAEQFSNNPTSCC